VIHSNFQNTVLKVKGQEQMADSKIFRNTFGDYFHIQIERIQFFKGEATGLADCQHYTVFVKGSIFFTARIQLKGNDNIDEIGKTFIKFFVGAESFQELLALFSFFKGDELSLFWVMSPFLLRISSKASLLRSAM